MRVPIEAAAFLVLFACTHAPERSVPPKVTRILPASPSIAVNVLRFSVEFDRPMREGFSKGHVQITDADGKPLTGVLLDPVHELWDRSHRRLTLILDPGRVKTGVGLNQQFGRAFEVGQKIRVVVAAGWPDTYDVPSQEAAVNEYIIGPVDEAQLSLSAWTISWPARHTRAPLKIGFPEELDLVSVLTFVKVRRSDAKGALAGEVRYAPETRQWSFTPESPWTEAAHELVVSERLEDLAGNNLQNAFESGPKSRDVPRPGIIRTSFIPEA